MIFPLMQEIKSDTHIKQVAELWSVYFNIYIPRQQAEDTKNPDWPNGSKRSQNLVCS
jgi:hypothetical protein